MMIVQLREVHGLAPATVRWENGALTVNGQTADPGAEILYSEWCATVSTDPAVAFEVLALPRDPAPPVQAHELAAEALRIEREGMEADKWQIVAVLNVMDPDLWARIEAWAAGSLVIDQIPPCDPVTRAAIAYAIRIPRMSQIVDLLAWLLGWSDDQVDDLFRAAMAMKR